MAIVPGVAASNANLPLPDAPELSSQPKNVGAGGLKKGLTLAAGVLTESAAGFGVGALIGQKGNASLAGVALLVFVASAIFALDVVLRYIPTGVDRNAVAYWFLGSMILTIVAVIPYTVMKKKGQGQKSAPVMAGLWTFSALMFTMAVASGGKGAAGTTNLTGNKAAAIQGSIISIMYMGLASIAGYQAQQKSPGIGGVAGSLWGLLAIFDMAGLSRA